VLAHAQKTDFVLRRKRRVDLKWRGRQFSRLLAAEVCASAVGMLDTHVPRYCEGYWLPIPFVSFPFISPPVRHCVPSHFTWTLKTVSSKDTLKLNHSEHYPIRGKGINSGQTSIMSFETNMLRSRGFFWYESISDVRGEVSLTLLEFPNDIRPPYQHAVLRQEGTHVTGGRDR
jgi:hypothetical protein